MINEQLLLDIVHWWHFPLGYFDGYHYNFYKLEIYYYNSLNWIYAISISLSPDWAHSQSIPSLYFLSQSVYPGHLCLVGDSFLAQEQGQRKKQGWAQAPRHQHERRHQTSARPAAGRARAAGRRAAAGSTGSLGGVDREGSLGGGGGGEGSLCPWDWERVYRLREGYKYKCPYKKNTEKKYPMSGSK